ncbi:hypothetical protein ABIA32_005293 [Streptacidiphilus sp. MAP12-20]
MPHRPVADRSRIVDDASAAAFLRARLAGREAAS